ncbi:hypothetical protein MIT1002_00584 [Alteromonas macleodii]|nr:hypothetical protein MIT1002_00584 [Alteromonas macleodii]VTP50563.1 hypothetical protein MIT1002_00584 [Alteromonas macleodii]
MIETTYNVAKLETASKVLKDIVMPKNLYNIDLYSFILSLDLKFFTVSEVTEKLLAIHSEEFTIKKNATQFTYRHLQKFVKEGTALVSKSESGKANVYRLVQSEIGDQKQEENSTLMAPHNEKDPIALKLQEKILRYKTEMLTNLGETEAYSELAEEVPELANYVKSRYQYSREQAKMMLGKVKAFERLLSDYQANTL